MNISNEKTQHQEVLNMDIFKLKKMLFKKRPNFYTWSKKLAKNNMSMFYFFLSFLISQIWLNW